MDRNLENGEKMEMWDNNNIKFSFPSCMFCWSDGKVER